MKTLFIIPSAIMSGNGNPDERFMQTLHTIDSIRARFPDSDIWLCESSIEPLKEWMKYMLKGITLIDFTKDPKIHEFKKISQEISLPVSNNLIEIYRLGFIKNSTESYVIYNTLSNVKKNRYDRIFKISGRYFLTEAFKINDHIKSNKIVLKEKTRTKLGKKYTNSDYYRHCVFWSCSNETLLETQKMFKNIHDYIINQAINFKIGDIEHGLEIFSNKNIVKDIKITGVVGRVNGESSFHAD